MARRECTRAVSARYAAAPCDRVLYARSDAILPPSAPCYHKSSVVCKMRGMCAGAGVMCGRRGGATAEVAAPSQERVEKV